MQDVLNVLYRAYPISPQHAQQTMSLSPDSASDQSLTCCTEQAVLQEGADTLRVAQLQLELLAPVSAQAARLRSLCIRRLCYLRGCYCPAKPTQPCQKCILCCSAALSTPPA